eukprot:scaffold7234_cov335-Prasinococcus_capsulatus_cf.AAC.16
MYTYVLVLPATRRMLKRSAQLAMPAERRTNQSRPKNISPDTWKPPRSTSPRRVRLSLRPRACGRPGKGAPPAGGQHTCDTCRRSGRRCRARQTSEVDAGRRSAGAWYIRGASPKGRRDRWAGLGGLKIVHFADGADLIEAVGTGRRDGEPLGPRHSAEYCPRRRKPLQAGAELHGA